MRGWPVNNRQSEIERSHSSPPENSTSGSNGNPATSITVVVAVSGYCGSELADRNVQAASFRLDVCRPYHLSPLFSFVGNELAKVSGRAGKHRTADFGEAPLYP